MIHQETGSLRFERVHQTMFMYDVMDVDMVINCDVQEEKQLVVAHFSLFAATKKRGH